MAFGDFGDSGDSGLVADASDVRLGTAASSLLETDPSYGAYGPALWACPVVP